MNFFFPFLKFLFKNSDLILVPGSSQEEFLINLGISKEKIILGRYASKNLSNIKLKKEKIKLFEKIIGFNKNQIRFLYFGRIVPYKGLDILIKAFSKLEKINPNVCLVISGNYDDDSYFKSCIDLSNNLSIKNILFLGPNVPKDITYIFNWTSICVFPVKFMKNELVCAESWGLVVNEALSQGKFVIGTDAIASAKDLLDSNSGFLVKNNDIEDLFLSMKKSCELKFEKSKIQKKVLEEYNHNKMFSYFENAINLVFK